MKQVKQVGISLLLAFMLIMTVLPLTALGATPWAPNTAYKTGDVVTYSNNTYQCVQGHTSLNGWEPPNVPALWSKQTSAPDTQAPSAPTALASSNITTVSVKLNWTASTDNIGVVGYDIYNGTTLAGSSASASYTVTGLTANTTYSFTVKAKDAAGNVSPASAALAVLTASPVIDTQPPTAPTNVSAGTVTSTTVALTWTASTDNVGVVGYDIYSGATLVGSSVSTAYSVTGLTAHTTYTFTVKAKDAVGNVSPASAALSVLTTSPDTQAPTAPSNVTAGTITTASIALSWTASTDNVGVAGYDVYNGSALAGSTSSTSFTVSGLTANTPYTFTVKAKDAAGNISAPSASVSATTLPVSSTKYEIVGYFPSWAAYNTPAYTPANVDASKLTVINYAFLDICWNGRHGNPSTDPGNPNSATWTCQNEDGQTISVPNGSIVLGDPVTEGTGGGGGYENLKKLKQLKTTNPNLKLFASVGGWTWSNQFSNTAADPITRANFAASAVSFLRQYNFDGIDIDWEYPNNIGVPCASGQTCQRTQDKANYLLLLQTLRQELDKAGLQDNKHYYTTIASGASSSFVAEAGGTTNWISKAAQSLDWINIMTYDFYGPWDSSSNMVAPLYHDPSDPSGNTQFSVDYVVNMYLNKGVPASKLAIGEPFYGYGWKGCSAGPNGNGLYQSCSGEATGGSSGSTYDFAFLQSNGFLSKDVSGYYTIGGQGFTRYWNNTTKTPFLYNSTTQIFITYDDEQSIHLKNEYLKTKGLRGGMFWELNADSNKTLQTIVSNDLPH
ncbi:chitinase [Paenibacillus sp. SYP-B3998]|uniref:chitinase n=1 Tax=Paenibacillus sp. SYP-B3998 TaxID=2678564 RepID=A0A6G4A1J0_9BACL|nr:glycosyl hydrolase family 18 protein [Paenibacillus sp. SYP-B3998]NEW08200.1 chitinase [Paenibacillus sp. SYP-B3998]